MISSILSAIVDTYSLRKGSGRFTGQCPKCGGSKDSNKFVIRDDAGFKCYGCGWKGDVITWLMEMEHMTCPQAYEASGRECLRTSCGVRGNCRMGDGTGRTARPTGRRSVAPLAEAARPELPVITEKAPDSLWASFAKALVASAAEDLPDQVGVLTWLDARGIDAAAATRFRLGWLSHDRKIDRAAIGLPPRADGKTTIWIPGGLLIPIFDDKGRIHRIRIRRTNAARDKFLPDLKYVWIEGSGNCPLVILPRWSSGENFIDHNGFSRRGAVVIEAELDAMACAAAHEQVTVIAIGSVSSGLPAPLRHQLADSPVILLALDAETGKDGKRGPGPAAIDHWTMLYRQARFWPVPTGKDPGDYAKAGGDLRAWIEAGLPPSNDVVKAEVTPGDGVPGLQTAEDTTVSSHSAPPRQQPIGKQPPAATGNAAAHDLSLCPACPQPGEGGEKDGEAVDMTVMHRILTLLDGREVYIIADEAKRQELISDNKIVFSENEFKRLRIACSGMSEAEVTSAAMLTVDLKETFASAYISAGRPQQEAA